MPANKQENYRSGGGQFAPVKGGQFEPAETDFLHRRKVVNLDRRGLDTLSVLSNSLFILLQLIFSSVIFAQPDSSFYNRNSSDKIHKEGKQENRINWFSQVKNDSTLKNEELHRWNEFVKMETRFFSQNKSIPVAEWKSHGPVNQGGRMISYAFNPQYPDELWAGAATGGLWKTNNAGDDWQAMTDNVPSCAIGAIAIHPQDPNKMLIGTGEGYLLSSWFKYGIGVLKSYDAGLTWNLTSLNVADSLKFACLNLVWDPVQTNRVYLATTFGVYVSTDEGDTWTQTLVGTASSLIINPQFPSNIYASLQNYGTSIGGIYQSTDSGNTWQPMTNGLPGSNQIGFTCLSLCDSFPDVIYAAVSYPSSNVNIGKLQGLYKTIDGGTNWTLMPFQYDFYCYAPPYDDVCQGWYANVIKVSHIDPNLVYAAGIYTYRSVDGGNSWDYWDYSPQESPPYTHVDVHQIAIHPSLPSKLFMFGDGGVYKSNNGGWSWLLANNNLVTTQFYYAVSAASNGNVAIGGTQDNGIWVNKNLDTSSLWFQFTYGDGFACAIDPNNENRMYTTELFQKRMLSTDGGVTHESINVGITGSNFFVTPIAIHPSHPEILFSATDTEIYRSIDSGYTWNSVSYKNYIITFAFDKINPDIIYAANDPALSVGRIYRSSDGGLNWVQVPSPGNKITDLETDPFQEGVLYATRSRFSVGLQVWKSLDKGDSWINITGDLPSVPANCLVVDPFLQDCYYVGTDLGVHITMDGGISWTNFNQGLPITVVQDMHFQKSDTTLRAATHGRGFWSTKTLNYQPVIADGVGFITDFKIFPNPVSDQAIFTFSNENNCSLKITMFNSLGQFISGIYNDTPESGMHEIAWSRKNTNGNYLSSGVYFIMVTANGKANVYKLVLN